MIFYPPQNISLRDHSKKSVFLGGSIGGEDPITKTCNDWQSDLANWLVELNYNVFNPRRPYWDINWPQSYEDPNFSQQVGWELNSLEKADIIIMYFDPAAKSPITLLELGLFKKKPMLVCCPDGFWRQGNVEIVCNRYGIEFTKDKELFFSRIVGMLSK